MMKYNIVYYKNGRQIKCLIRHALVSINALIILYAGQLSAALSHVGNVSLRFNLATQNDFLLCVVLPIKISDVTDQYFIYCYVHWSRTLKCLAKFMFSN